MVKIEKLKIAKGNRLLVVTVTVKRKKKKAKSSSTPSIHFNGQLNLFFFLKNTHPKTHRR